MAFIKKNWQKDASKNGVALLMQVAGASAGAYVSTKIMNKDGSNTSATLKNLINPALLAVGTLGSLMFENEHLRNLSNGLATISAIKALAKIAPDTLAPAFGYQAADFKGLGEQPIETANLMGMGTIGAIGATTEDYTGSQLEEFTDVTPQTDGNDWNSVADQIDYEQSIQVNGVDGVDGADEDANLMGLGDPDEMANLMGLGDPDEEDDTSALMGMF